MNRFLVALIATTACASIARADPAATAFSLADALAAASGTSPTQQAADAGLRAAEVGRRVAALRPNPTIGADIENVGGSRAYDTIEAPKQTVTVALPVELGGKRSARIAVANAQRDRAGIDRVVAGADVRLAVTEAYTDALAADRRLANAREQAVIAADGLQAAQVRVQAGRASPLEEQRARVLRLNADLAVERAAKLADAARTTLGLRISRPVPPLLDGPWFDRIGTEAGIGPRRSDTLAVAAARADVVTAAAQARLAQSQRLPDVTLSTGVRRLPFNNDVAAVFGFSVPLPLFNDGSAAVDQARAEQSKADAQRRVAERDAAEAMAKAEADLDNAASAARAATGPTLASAQEAARIARIGYREGKFGQLDLIDAERALAETRLAAIDALAAYHDARARLDRLTATEGSIR
jgi:cobalt-zinc-cadmium efflux system outer membrane protein